MVKSSPLLPASTWLEELARQIDRTREVVEPEPVHRLRVAAGRLSVWLELGARRALRDDLRRLRRSAAAVRDLDVMTAHEGGAAWAEALRTERAREAVSLRTVLASQRIETLVEALGLVPDPDPVCVRSSLQRLKRRVMRAGDRLDESEGEEARKVEDVGTDGKVGLVGQPAVDGHGDRLGPDYAAVYGGRRDHLDVAGLRSG